jgi:hypothetical protein
MMMSRIVSYLLAALNCTEFVSANTAFGEVVENHDLAKVISQYHGTHIVVEDLAFFLATHDYNSTPKAGCVQVPIEGTIYKVPYSAAEPSELTVVN